MDELVIAVVLSQPFFLFFLVERSGMFALNKYFIIIITVLIVRVAYRDKLNITEETTGLVLVFV